jgi:hypothetical protein
MKFVKNKNYCYDKQDAYQILAMTSQTVTLRKLTEKKESEPETYVTREEFDGKFWGALGPMRRF